MLEYILGTVKLLTKLVNRTFTHWLTYSFMDYDKNVASNKQKCPYDVPTKTLELGDETKGVKWLQWQLVEAGYDIKIDGIYGNATLKAVKKFKQSSKITPINGKITEETIKALKND